MSRADASPDVILSGGRRPESKDLTQRPATSKFVILSGGRRPESKDLSKPLTLAEVRLWARIGVLGALALVLSYIETFIPLPVPVPGIKLGLANIVVLVALQVLDAKSAAAVALVKVLAAGFLFGSPIMIAYSGAGTLLAFASMALLSRIPGLHVVPIAIVGAILHNVGQLVVAMLILGTPLVWATAPILVVAACITGMLSGVATAYTLGCLEERR